MDYIMKRQGQRFGLVLTVLAAIGLASLPMKVSATSPGTTNRIWHTGGMIDYSTAALGSNGDFYIGCKDYRVWSFNTNGSTNLSFLTQGIVQGSPALGADGTIY